MKKKICIAFVLLFGFIATANLWHSGYPLTHDGDVHLMRLTNFYQNLTDGIVIPRWAPHVNWGYGQPVFEFFYPLPLYIGSLFHAVGLSFATSLKLILGGSLILSGVTMYVWLASFMSEEGACMGAFLYMFAPYRFVDTYVRGDIGEGLALVFVPLVFYFLRKCSEEKNKYGLIWAGVFLAVVILSHNIVSLMSLPLVIFYAFYLLFFVTQNKKRFIVRFLFMVVVGFSLSAFFWIPGLFEGKYTLRDIVTKGGYITSFVSLGSLLWGKWSYGISGQFTTQIGVLQWLTFFVGLCIVPFQKNKAKQILIIGLLGYSLIAIFFMLPISNFIWSKIILLQNFQFPWRFLLVTTFCLAVVGGFLVDMLPQRLKGILITCLIGGVILLEYPYMHAKAYVSRPDAYFSGIIDAPSDTGESTPIWGVRFMEHRFTAPLEVLSGSAQVQVDKRTSVQHEYSVTVHTPTTLMENTLYFPGWQVLVDGKEVSIEFQDQQHRGLMIFDVSKGVHSIVVRFTETKFRLFSDYCSIFGFIVAACLFFIQYKKRIL